MMIRAFLDSFGILTAQDIEDCLQYAQPLSLKKSDYLIEIGQVAQRVAFVEHGILRSFYYSDNADEITYCMLFPNMMVSAYSSLITGKPTEESIQAMTNTELQTIAKVDLDRIAEGNIRWTKLLRIMAERAYVDQEDRIFRLQRSSALDRYSQLLDDHPEYVQQIPQRYLASYLGITQRHLSRIRGQLAK